MANVFKRAALTFGRWTGLKREPEVDPQLALIEPVAEAMSQQSSAIDSTPQADNSEVPTSASKEVWDDTLDLPGLEETQDTEAAVAMGEILEPVTLDATPAPDQPVQIEPVGFVTEAVASSATPQAIAPAPDAPVEIKPTPQLAPVAQSATHNISFTELYELISKEVNKRTDSAVNVYERLLLATRDELENTRRNNRLAWSVGGVMTAVTALGAVWAAGEVSATRVELSSLKQQVSMGQQASVERDQLRGELFKAREASAKIELDSLRSRLDQALAVTAERDRLRSELDTARKARFDVEAELRNELRVAREVLSSSKAAATQPVSQAFPAAGQIVAQGRAVEHASGAERPDVWSIILDGRD